MSINLQIANAALANFDLSNPALTFLGQSENTSFKVETSSGNAFLLRFHKGINHEIDTRDDWREASVIESELLWLNALANDTELTVPDPVQNRFGQWITTVADEHLNRMSCSLLRWVQGQHLNNEPTPKQLYQIGVLLARLHEHSSGWTPPPLFNRPAYDSDRLQNSLMQLSELLPNKITSTTDFECFEKAVAVIQNLMRRLARTPENWGLIHADLHDGNYLFYFDEARAIDFSRCGFGFYFYDVAMALNFVCAPLRAHLLNGYNSVRAFENCSNLLEAFFIAATVENFAFLSANPQEHNGLTQAISEVAANHVRPFLQGVSFLNQK